MTLSAMEFLRRFVQHILPRGFVRIRQSGFLANPCRAARVALARALLTALSPARSAVAATDPSADSPSGTWTCPRCGASMIVGPILSPLQLANSRLRHVMTAGHPRHDQRLRQRGRPRLGSRVPPSVIPAPSSRFSARTPHRPDHSRRRSSAGGPAIHLRERHRILFPAP